jgi:hypothetical protein
MYVLLIAWHSVYSVLPVTQGKVKWLKMNTLGNCLDRKRMKISGSNEETRAVCRSPDITTLMKLVLLQSVEGDRVAQSV